MTIKIDGTNGIVLPNGTAALPSTTGPDLDTGISYGDNTLRFSTGGVTAMTIDAGQNVTFNNSPTNGMRNRIINGNMDVAQRGSTFTDGNGYTLDRWYGNRAGAVAGVTYAQVYGAFGTNTNGLYIQRTIGNTSTAAAALYQAIEGINSRDLAGKTITVSFQVGSGSISSTTGHSVYVFYQTTTTDIGPASGAWTALTAQSFTVASSSSYTQKTFQFSIPPTATQLQLNIQFAFSGTAGADDRFYLTQVQLEAGAVASSFERRMYGTELALCQRYYEICQFTASVSTPITYPGNQYKVSKRTAATLTFVGTNNGQTFFDYFGVAGPYGQSFRQLTNPTTATDCTIYANAEL